MSLTAFNCLRASHFILSDTVIAKNRKGFTFVEILVTVCILAILGALAAISYGPLIRKAQYTKCISHMRVIHSALAAHLYDKACWPQDPKAESDDDLVDEVWWVDALDDYGAPASAWICPAVAQLTEKDTSGTLRKIHYTPSEFDTHIFSPFKYPTQPWLLEIASVHVSGPNVCFPDGSIRGIYDLLPHLKKQQ